MVVRRSAVAPLALGFLFAIGSVASLARAATLELTDPAAFAAATTAPTTIGFGGILPAGKPYQVFNPLVAGGVSFFNSNTNVTVVRANFYAGHPYSADFIVNQVHADPSAPDDY